MDWLPAAANFSQSLLEISAISDPSARFRKIVSIAKCRLSYLETIQLDNVLLTVGSEANLRDCVPVKIAILGSSTFDHLLPALRIAGLRRGLRLTIFTGSFGQYRQEILRPDEKLSIFCPDVVMLSISSQEVLTALGITSNQVAVDQEVDLFVNELRGLWARIKKTICPTVIQQALLDTSYPILGSFDKLVPGSASRIVAQANDALAIAAKDVSTLWLDIAARSARDGIDHWYDASRWYHAKIEVSPKAAMDYGELVSRLLGAKFGKSGKCLVLDLDNTLWGGVIGDDGLEGIVLGPGSAIGEAHLALQKYAKTLNDAGVVLAVCSKNEEETAKEPFRSHPEMLLKIEDIAVFVANWRDKAENLVRIAEKLNIGLEALVFIDDNPAERERVRQALPEIIVPELPNDPSLFIHTIANAGLFEAVALTADDHTRAQQYRQNTDREASRAQSQSIPEFLENLAMTVEYGPVDEVSLTRVVQLINKTNQFNATTRRMDGSEIVQLMKRRDYVLLKFRLTDRFGDNGLVSVVLLNFPENQPDRLTIDNWVMSCRVFGRELECEILNIIVEIAAGRNLNLVQANYVATDRNQVIYDAYQTMGFEVDSENADESREFRLAISNFDPHKTKIRRVKK